MKEHLNDLKAGGRPMTREELAQENKQLQNNWNELKKWLEETIKYDENWYKPECKEYIGQKQYPDDTIDGFRYALDKMQELEGNNE